jgi:putative transposase
MNYNPDIHHRRSIRLHDYDYTSAGAYFVTICTQGRECLFGEIDAGKIILNYAGRMIQDLWTETSNKFPEMETDTHIVMPNHFHGIVFIVGALRADTLISEGKTNIEAIGKITAVADAKPGPALGDIVGAFKSLTTHAYINGVAQQNWPSFPGKLWQRNYYERVIRNDNELTRAREYIVNNPLKWPEDENNPGNMSIKTNVPKRAGTRPAPTGDNH